MRKNMRTVVVALIMLALSAGSGMSQGKTDKPSKGTPKRNTLSTKKKPKKSKLSANAEARAKIERELGKKTKPEFRGKTLGEAVQHLSSSHKIPIQLHKSLKKNDIGSDTRVTLVIDKTTTLHSALKKMLGQLDMTYMIDRKVLFIVTRKEAEQNALIKVYNVTDLLTSRNTRRKIQLDPFFLIEMITTQIQPQSWIEVGGFGTLEYRRRGAAKILIIKQTDPVHHQIAERFKKIRNVAGKGTRTKKTRKGARSVPRRP